MNKKHRNYNYTHAKRSKHCRFAVVVILLATAFIIYGLISRQDDFVYISPARASDELLSPLEGLEALEEVQEVEQGTEERGEDQESTKDELKQIDIWVGEAVDEFFTGGDRSKMRQTMHCLLNRESTHYMNKGHGDGGKAGGALQFHQETWERMRLQMIKVGLADEVKSRYDLKEAIRTTVWAIKQGRGKEWGPISRWFQGRDDAVCELSVSAPDEN